MNPGKGVLEGVSRQPTMACPYFGGLKPTLQLDTWNSSWVGWAAFRTSPTALPNSVALKPLLEAGFEVLVDVAVQHLVAIATFHASTQILDARII